MFEVWQVGVVIMAVLTGVNLLSARSYGEFEFWFASTKVVAIAVFIVVAGLFARFAAACRKCHESFAKSWR